MVARDNGRVLIVTRMKDRSEMVTEMFAAAERLGIHRWEIRSKSEGFDVPRPIASALFPSLFPEEG
jgi:hypothetical protein